MPLEEVNGRPCGILGYHEGLDVVFLDDRDPFIEGSDEAVGDEVKNHIFDIVC